MGIADRAREERRRGRLEGMLAAFQAGAVGGLTANYNDEMFGGADELRAAHDASPGAYAAGEAAGSLPLAFLGSGLAKAVAGGMGGRGRLLMATLAGAAHGALAGSGGFRPGEMSAAERWQNAAMGAGIGGAVGGLGVPGTRAVRQLADNAPAILGREALAEGGVRQVMPFTGTRTSAPLGLTLAGEGDVATRARAAMQSAMSQDEAGMVRDMGQAVLGRWANDGRNLRAFGADELGQSMGALRSLGAQSPGGSAAVEGMAQDMIEQNVRRNMRAMRAPPRGSGGGLLRLAKQEADDFAKTFDDPAFHKSWLREARRLDDGQKAQLAARMVRQLRTKAKASMGGEAEAFQRYLRNPVIADKLKELGVNVGNIRGARRAGQEIEREVARLRELARRPSEPRYDFRNYDDRDLASRGTLGDEDARALLEAMMQPQRAFAVRPDSGARILQGQYERGVRFDPAAMFNAADLEDVMGSVRYSQPVAAALPALMGIGYADR